MSTQTQLTQLWVEKYRSTNFDEYVFNDADHKVKFQRMVNDGEIPHLLLSGTAGSGKTTLSKLLVRLLNIDPCDVLLINASDENSVDVMREKISTFAMSYSIGSFKVIQLEEADYLSPNAQAVLRVIMEEASSNCRFILTANYDNKIIPAIKSRCTSFHFKSPSQDDTLARCAEILLSENIDFELELLETYISVYYPDLRQIINVLQSNSIDGKLLPPKNMTGNDDYKFKILDYLTSGDLRSCREVVCKNVGRDEYEDVYRFLYENLSVCEKFKDVNAYESGIVLIANYLYKHSLCADPEINLAALFIELNNL